MSLFHSHRISELKQIGFLRKCLGHNKKHSIHSSAGSYLKTGFSCCQHNSSAKGVLTNFFTKETECPMTSSTKLQAPCKSSPDSKRWSGLRTSSSSRRSVCRRSGRMDRSAERRSAASGPSSSRPASSDREPNHGSEKQDFLNYHLCTYTTFAQWWQS